MNVLMISPGFPAEMPHFTRGLARVGANVIGLGDQPQSGLPEEAAESLAAYVQVRSFADEAAVLEQVRELSGKTRIDLVECLWEPFMILAARIREMLELPGLTVEETIPFRDKEVMKQVLDRAGIRTPRHASAKSESAVREAAEAIGYPLIVKPIAGAGSSDTYRIDDDVVAPISRSAAGVKKAANVDASPMARVINVSWTRRRRRCLGSSTRPRGNTTRDGTRSAYEGVAQTVRLTIPTSLLE